MFGEMFNEIWKEAEEKAGGYTALLDDETIIEVKNKDLDKKDNKTTTNEEV